MSSPLAPPAESSAVSNHPRRLTDYANCAGCAGKLASLGITQLLSDLPPRPNDPNLLVATETRDDAGVYQLNDGLALVQTVDFFPPLVDDPRDFGRIAAANALSDVYAMNGRPLTVLNLVGFPDDELPLSLLGAILRGASEIVTEAGAVTVGGHSIRDREIKFGLSVTGLADPAAVWTNAAARPGDLLILTKPLGTGFITTAAKRRSAPETPNGSPRPLDTTTADLLTRAVASMTQLNRIGQTAAHAAPVGTVHAVTDVTGYGLAGHGFEMAHAAGVHFEFRATDLPRFPGVESLATPEFRTRAAATNRAFVADHLVIAQDADPIGVELAFDPQTSGGLLMAVAPEAVEPILAELQRLGALAAAVVGRVVALDRSSNSSQPPVYLSLV